MKKILFAVIFTAMMPCAFAQESESPLATLLKKTLTEAEYNSEEITSEQEFMVYDQDVLTYFNLNEDYSTPLQRSNFMKTAEYKALADSLGKLKKNFFKEIRYISFDGKNESGKVEFDMTANGFYFVTGYEYYPSLKNLPNVYTSKDEVNIKFSNLNTPVRLVQTEDEKNMEEKAAPRCYFFMPCNPVTAEKIEKSQSFPTVWIFFQPTSIIKNKELPYEYAMPADYETVNYLNVTVKRVLVTLDDEVVYDKKY